MRHARADVSSRTLDPLAVALNHLAKQTGFPLFVAEAVQSGNLGLAWVFLLYCKKRKFVHALTEADFSASLRRDKLHLLIPWLPSSLTSLTFRPGISVRLETLETLTRLFNRDIPALPQLKHLQVCISDRSEESPHACAFFHSLPVSSMETLSLEGSEVGEKGWLALGVCFEKGLKLKSLSLSRCSLDTAQAKTLFSRLPPSLATLSAEGTELVGSGGWEVLWKRMEKGELPKLGCLCVPLYSVDSQKNPVCPFRCSGASMETLTFKKESMGALKGSPQLLGGGGGGVWKSLFEGEGLKGLKKLEMDRCLEVEPVFGAVGDVVEVLRLDCWGGKGGDEGVWKGVGEKMKKGEMSQLRDLRLSSFPLDGGKGVALFPFLPDSLQTLCLSWSSIDLKGWECLGQRMERGGLRGLRSLDLAGCGLTGPGCRALVRFLPSSLQALNLNSNEQVDEIGWMSLGDKMEERGLGNLEVLKADACMLDGQKAGAFLRFLPESLKSLSLSENPDICLSGWSCLGERMKMHLHQVERLELVNCNVQGEGGGSLFPFLPPSVKVLKLNCNESFEETPEKQGWESLAKTMHTGGLPRLSLFDVTDCSLETDSACQLISSLPESLQVLVLDRNDCIDKNGWEMIGSKLKKLRRLREVSLAQCELTREKFLSVVPSLPRCLQSLKLSDNTDCDEDKSQWEVFGSMLQKGHFEALSHLSLRQCSLFNKQACAVLPYLPSTVESVSVVDNPVALDWGDNWGEGLRSLGDLGNLRGGDVDALRMFALQKRDQKETAEAS